MSTHDGFYKQVDGLAMGSPLAPHLAIGWLSQFKNLIKDDTKIMRWMKSNTRGWNRNWKKLTITIHKNQEFTLETEVDHNLSFLDRRLSHDHETGKLIPLRGISNLLTQASS